MSFFPWWIKYPYENDEILNLDFLLKVSNENTEKIENFVNLNTIKYADPILWDITSQYEANTIVVDPQTGDAYISTKAVPYGVILSNEDYWTKIYNYASELHILREQIGIDEELSPTATAPRAIGDIVFLDGLLYIVTSTMIAGDTYVEGSNCEKITINDLLFNLHEEDTLIREVINAEMESRTEADSELEGKIEGVASELEGKIEEEATARTEADNDLRDYIEEHIVYNPVDLDSTDLSNIGLHEGTYTVASNLTINAQLIIPKGAIIFVASGATLTINGQILAGRYKIFEGTGNIVVNNAYQPFGYPEWFGAVVNDNNVNNTDAIYKCYSIFTNTELSSGDYYVSTTLKLNRSNRSLKGVHRLDWSFNSDDNKGTRIVATNPELTIVQIGTDDQPSSINSFVQNVSLEDLTVFRDVSGYAFSNNSIGILSKFILRSKLEYVSSMNSDIGFDIVASVYCHFIKCKSFTTVTSTGDATRNIRGFRIPEIYDIGLAGSNASIYIQDCSATVGGGIIYDGSFGVQCYGSEGCSDIFIEGLEVGGMNYGIMIEGSNTLNEANDIHITNCVLDGIGQTGILLVNFAGNGVCNIQGNYVAPSSQGSSNFACYRLVGCTGAIALTNNQAICLPLSSGYGIKLETCAGVVSEANMITESEFPINITGCASCGFNDSIINRVTNNVLDAVLFVQSSHCKAECSINGGNTFFQNAYRTYQSAGCEFNVTKVISSSKSYWYDENSTKISTTGVTTGNNLISGMLL